MVKKLILETMHGLIGEPSDWECLEPLEIPIRPRELESWDVDDEFVGDRVLVGYSLGGRLAMQALLKYPHKWRAAIIISAHPGLADPQARQIRLKDDKEWSKRFETEEWEMLMESWNSRPVFSGHKIAADASKRTLYAARLKKFSLGLQEDLRPQIANLKLPILWVVGEEDSAYCKIADTMHFRHPHSMISRVPQAGHRVPWQQPEQLASLVQNFVTSL